MQGNAQRKAVTMAGRRKAKRAAKAEAKALHKRQSRGKTAWKLFDRAATTAAAVAAPKVSQLAWRTLSGRTPPQSARHPDVSAKEAVTWALVGGGLAEVTKIAIRRGAANYWKRSTGNLPPGMKPVQGQSSPGSAETQPAQSLQ